MGTKIRDLIETKEIEIKDLSGKVLAIDAYNYLYQFLTTIRQADGAPLTDSKGRVTSHINGLFYRTMKLIEHNIKLVFVFDGVAPKIKQAEIEKRTRIKEEARQRLDEARLKEDIEVMRKMASRVSYLSKEMVEESKELITAMGQIVVDAPSEGEAQASDIVKKEMAYACVSQDYDALLFGCPTVIRNLSIEGKRRKAGTRGYYKVKPEIINLAENLNRLGIDKDQLIVLGMLIGTDYCIGGIPRIGPKKSLLLVKQYGKRFNELFEFVKWNEFHSIEWREIFYTIKKMPTLENVSTKWEGPDIIKLEEFLVERGFSSERIKSKIEIFKPKKQKDLSKWF